MKMKTKFNSIALLLFLTLSFSCSETELGCYGCQDDTIGLSKGIIQFSAENNSTTITTQGKSWWLSEITLDGKRIDISGLQRTSHQLKIEKPEFTFERKNENEIFIQMSKNTSKKERKLIVSLQHLNYFGNIYITQTAD